MAHAGAAPVPGRPDLAQLGLEHWHERAESLAEPDRSAARALAESDDGRHLLASIFGNSPFLGRTLLNQMPYFTTALDKTPEQIFDSLVDDVRTTAQDETQQTQLMARLRTVRSRMAVTIALADILAHWNVMQVVRHLSVFADAAVYAALDHLVGRAIAQGELSPVSGGETARSAGLFVIAMGKLGAFELNYSSDIDLIVLFDPARVTYHGRRSVQETFIRITRDLVKILQERTADGYVFRTDLRLRPDPGATPVALSTLGAELYYESQGQNWERAAMIKARVNAGDLSAGSRFLKGLTPFVWRRHLDFAAIQDIHSIKRQINAHRGGSTISLHGHNVKLGRGGIREIEFFAQTQQLIWGGRDPGLRPASTLGALQALAGTERISEKAQQDLTAAYHFLRMVEHRLQMVDDQQTQTLPKDDAGLAALAAFCGYAGIEPFAADLLGHLGRVERHYAGLFEESPSLTARQRRTDGSGASRTEPPGNLVFTGEDDDPDTLETLKQLGFDSPSSVASTVRLWHRGRYQATRSERARQLLTELMPDILHALSDTAYPATAFTRFDDFLRQLPAGVQLFSMFATYPSLLGLVAEILGTAPMLADQLSRHPALLERVLISDMDAPLGSVPALSGALAVELQGIEHFEDVLTRSQRWVNDRKFQVGLQILKGLASGEETSRALTALAEAAVIQIHHAVSSYFARRHGRIGRGDMAIVALGKLGGGEMTVGSDLDLVFVYDEIDPTEMSDGDRPLPATVYFARLSQRLIAAITAPTAEGTLYEVDMRLRPSGNAGPIACSLDAFRRYHEENAWTWEHMALSRARVISGPPDLTGRIEKVLAATLTAPRDRDALLRDVAAMRNRVMAEKPPQSIWDVKLIPGGLLDIEFITQYLQLRFAQDIPDILSPRTDIALARLERHDILSAADARLLREAGRFWRDIQGLQRLTTGDHISPRGTAPGVQNRLAAVTGATIDRGPGGGATVDFDTVEQILHDTATRVRAVYDRIIAAPAQALAKPPDHPAAQ